MKIETIELRKLVPNEGYVLTDGINYSKDDVYLGCNDSEDNWSEITVEEYEKILADQEE